MERKNLLATAKVLKQVEAPFAQEYSSKMEMLVSKMNQLMESREDITELVGKNNVSMMKDNHANHARFMESIFHQHSPETLLDTVLWVFRAYRSRNFSSTYWAAQLNTWVEIYRAELSPDCFNAIYPYYKWMQINIPAFNMIAESNLDIPLASH
jgi:uncharacterized membrane-anchored protein YjiN (DUF445 family)